jgi:excisionase family DNA binding protein
MSAHEEYVTATEATHLLEVSKVKMAKLLRSGEIPYIPDPRNERAKLIKRSDIDAWLAKAPRPRVPHRRREQPPAIDEQRSASA